MAILSYGLWQRRFGGDPGILGRSIEESGTSITVVGVMPQGFSRSLQGMPGDPSSVDLWMPMGLLPYLSPGRINHCLNVVGRRKPDSSIASAEAELNIIYAQLAQQYPTTNRGETARLVPIREEVVGSYRSALWILLAAAGAVLLIACSNVANLMLSRTSGRRREIAVRAALGASRLRLARQLFTESLLLAVAGGLAGLLLASWGVDALRTLAPGDIPHLQQSGLTRTVGVFGFAATILTVLLFGTAPVLRLSDLQRSAGLRESSRTHSAGRKSSRFRGWLVISQIAMALLLSMDASLLIRSLDFLVHEDLGFRPDNVLAFGVPLFTIRSGQGRINFVEQVLGKVRAIPGVRMVGLSNRVPLGADNMATSLEIEGHAAPSNVALLPQAHTRAITPGYFEALGVDVESGRLPADSDDAKAVPIVVINEAAARTFWPGQEAVGKRLKVAGTDPFSAALNGAPEPWLTVVGVVRNVKNDNLTNEARPEIFVPFAQRPWIFATFMVSSSGHSEGLAVAVTAAVHSVNNDLPVTNIQTMTKAVADSVAQPRFRAVLLGIFAVLALALAAAGVYGVTSYSVGQRTHEIGLRVALGAGRKEVLQLIFREQTKLLTAGAALGLAGSLTSMHFVSGLLFGIKSGDLASIAISITAISAATLLAAYLPARRAARLDPMVVLRED
jgi:putative ABC transport system permease protein